MENKKIIKENEFIEFYNSRRYEANCFNEDGSLNKNYNFFKSTGLIASIFEDHWKEVYFKNKKIIDYDGTYVTFSYIDHKDNRYHQVKLHAHDFIMTLLRHILPSQFKIIRYYGFYSFKHSIHLKMVPLIKEHCRKVRKQLLKYELSISMSFHRNPFHCHKCDTKLDFALCIE